jgi:transposase-like protein
VGDYPRTLKEFEERFATEQACRSYLEKLRWPTGFCCPRCQGRRAVRIRAILMQCYGCRRQTSVTAGTIFQDTRKPLAMWFRALWYVTSQTNGASALRIQQVLGLGSYETAWTWLHKLRRVMVQPDHDRLSGWIEVDEASVSVAGPKKANKALIVIAAQADGAGIGRIRMRAIPDASATSLHSFVLDSIEPGSTLHTEGWHGYVGLDKKGYHQEVYWGRSQGPSQLMPRVYKVALLLKGWLAGIHQGAVSHEHLPYYLDEFTFRFNRRRSKGRGKLFYRLLQQAANTPQATYQALVERVESGRSAQKH